MARWKSLDGVVHGRREGYAGPYDGVKGQYFSYFPCNELRGVAPWYALAEHETITCLDCLADFEMTDAL